MHKLRLELDRHLVLFESDRGTSVVISKSYRNNSSTSNHVGNAFQTLFFTDFAIDIQNSGKHLRATCIYIF